METEYVLLDLKAQLLRSGDNLTIAKEKLEAVLERIDSLERHLADMLRSRYGLDKTRDRCSLASN